MEDEPGAEDEPGTVLLRTLVDDREPSFVGNTVHHPEWSVGRSTLDARSNTNSMQQRSVRPRMEPLYSDSAVDVNFGIGGAVSKLVFSDSPKSVVEPSVSASWLAIASSLAV